MIEALAPYSKGLIYLAIELTVVLFILAIGVIVHQIRQRKQRLQTASEFVNKVDGVETARREKLEQTFSRNLGLEGEELAQKVAEFLEKESAFYKTLLTVFLSKEPKFLNKAYSELNGVMENWSDIVPEGIVDDTQIKQLNEDIIKLKEENDLMSGKVKQNHDEMEALMFEYTAAFRKNDGSEQSRNSPVIEERKEAEHTDQENGEKNSPEEPPVAEPIEMFEDVQTDMIVETEFEGLLDLSNHESGINEQDTADSDPAMAIAEDLGELLNAAVDEHSADLLQQDSTEDSDDPFLAESDDGLEQSIADSETNSLTDQPVAPEPVPVPVPEPELKAATQSKPEAQAEQGLDPFNDSADTDAVSAGDSFARTAAPAAAPDAEPAVDNSDIDALLAMPPSAPEDPVRTTQTATPEAVATEKAQSLATEDTSQGKDSPVGNNSQPRQAPATVSSVATEHESVVDDAAMEALLETDETESTTPEVADVTDEPETASSDAVQEPRSPTEQLINNLDFDLSRADEEPEILDITIAEMLPEETGADGDFFDLTKSD